MATRSRDTCTCRRASPPRGPAPIRQSTKHTPALAQATAMDEVYKAEYRHLSRLLESYSRQLTDITIAHANLDFDDTGSDEDREGVDLKVYYDAIRKKYKDTKVQLGRVLAEWKASKGVQAGACATEK